ncbi:hypothetical protein FH972_005380 [Carpinus fangiana]|uniref:Uncharacterized protein n=1 Tax=Carpinus fangiana TaxID=176857 RepID=A0A5N6QQ12_9ROSI|nr:hypothetical protein FH972_005380 [Carpinus fangiana]
MGIRESIKGKCCRRSTDSVDHSSSNLNSQQLVGNSPAAITPTEEEPFVSPSSDKRSSLLIRRLRRMWQTTKGWFNWLS